MNKEIREGIRGYIDQAQGYVEGCCPIDDITDSLIAYLHSQGVVIKGESLGVTHPHLANYFTMENLIDEEI